MYLSLQEEKRAIEDAAGQLVVPTQGVPRGRQVLQEGPRVLQQHPHQSGVLHARGVQRALAVDGGKVEGHEASGQHFQKNR